MSEQVNTLVVEGEELVVATCPPVGEQLRVAREARGLQVQDIAHTLKLGQRQVEALECGDWNSLPGNTFIRGFVRNYARLIQVDSAPLMRQLDDILEKPVNSLGVSDAVPTAMPHSGSAGMRRSKLLVLLGVVSVILAGVAYFLMPSDLNSLRDRSQALLDSMARKDQGNPASSPVTNAPDPIFPPGTTPQQVMNPQALSPAELQVAASSSGAAVQPSQSEASDSASSPKSAPQMRFVFDKDSWLEVRDRDNKVVFSQRLAAGSEQVLSGQGPLSVTIGYAPGARLFWHGETVDLVPYTRGDVARLVLE